MKIDSRDVSEGSFLVEFPAVSDADANRAAVALAERVGPDPPRGLLDAIPGARTLFVIFDPRLVRRESVVRRLRRLADGSATTSSESRRFRIPVAYGGESGPDLPSLARDRGIAPEELARRHAAGEYTVVFLGFSPGFAYMTGLPAGLAAPRLESPRTRVPAGSVAIGGEYTAIYPSETPGGWRLIGRSPVRLFDATARPPALLRPGDRVSFEAIGEQELRARLAESEIRNPAAAVAADEDAFFETVKAGLFTSVQGAPRYGLGASGVPAGGAMDLPALARGNAILGNPAEAAALEMTVSGPEFLVRGDGLVCVSGGDLDVRRNGIPVPLETSVPARAGDRITFGHASRGARAYLCVEGGLAQPLSGEPVRRLGRGDVVFRARPRARPRRGEPPDAFVPVCRGELMLSILPGPQLSDFPPDASDRLFSSTYRVSPESDRRGIRLHGPSLELTRPPDIPPEGTALGAIQIPANGQPIVLGPDRPVTGGYAKIGTVIARDWPRLAQAVPGSAVRFRPTMLAEALEDAPGTAPPGSLD